MCGTFTIVEIPCLEVRIVHAILWGSIRVHDPHHQQMILHKMMGTFFELQKGRQMQ